MDYESVIPNPKLKLLEQIREVMRLKHYHQEDLANGYGWRKGEGEESKLSRPVLA